MNTANAGSPNPEHESQPQQGLPLGIALIAAGVALLFAILVGPRLVGLLSAILSPPLPPIPADVIEVSYEELAYGIDNWTYQTDSNICDLIAFYESNEGQCPVLPPTCQSGDPQVDQEYLALCTGDIAFAAFMMRWRLEIPHRSSNSTSLNFHLSRQISWAGELPPETP